MSPRVRPAVVRFYFDADLLGLAKVLTPLRSDMTYPGDTGAVVHKRERPPCVISDRSTLDEVWIPQVAAQFAAVDESDGQAVAGQYRPQRRNGLRQHSSTRLVGRWRPTGSPRWSCRPGCSTGSPRSTPRSDS